VPEWRLRSVPALSALAGADSAALQALAYLIADPDARVRSLAARSIGITAAGGSREALRLLLACADSPDDAVRKGAAEGLGSCAGTYPRAMTRLAAMLSDGSPQVRAAAAEAAIAARAGKPGLRTILAAVARAAENDEYVCNALSHALFNLANQGASIAQRFAARMARSASERLRWCAAAAAGAVSDGESTALLLETDTSALVRIELARSIGKAAPPWGEAAMTRMAAIRNSQVAAAAVEALGSYASQQSLETALRAGRARSQLVRTAAAHALAGILNAGGNGRAATALHALGRDAAAPVRQAAASALGTITGPGRQSARTRIEALARDNSVHVRAASARASARLGLEEVLLGLAGDKSPGVRSAAAAGLGALSPTRLVLSALAKLSADPGARAAAASALGSLLDRHAEAIHQLMPVVLGLPEARPALASLQSACHEPDLCAALGAWVDVLDAEDPAAGAALAAERFAACRREFCREFARFWRSVVRLLSANRLDQLGQMGRLLADLSSSLLLADGGSAQEAWAALSATAAAAARAARSTLPTKKVEHLAAAAQALDEAQDAAGLSGFAANVVGSIARAWRAVVSESQRQASGQAEIVVSLLSQNVLRKPILELAVMVGNDGAAAARDVRVSFGAGAGLTPLQPDCELGELAPGLARQARAQVRCTATAEKAQIRCTISWSDVSERRRPFTFDVALRSARRRFRPTANPYLPGKPLAADSPMFFGRGDVFQRLRQALWGTHQCNVVGLIGQRRSGKTSIALRLERELGDCFLPVVIDVQGLLVDSIPLFSYQVASQTRRALARESLVADRPDPTEAKKPSFLADYLARAAERAGTRRLLVVLDEFADLQQRVETGMLPEALFSYLRNLMQHAPHIPFLLCGTHRIEDLDPAHWRTLFNLAVYRNLGPLDDESARALATVPMDQAGVVWEDRAIERILRLCGGQPYLIQLTGHCLIAQMNERRTTALDAGAVEASVPTLRQWGKGHLRYLRQLCSADEQAVLRALASGGPWGDYAGIPDLTGGLPELGRERIEQALAEMAEKGIAEPSGTQGPFWRLQIGLLADDLG
jgi:HEAT repeat protein